MNSLRKSFMFFILLLPLFAMASTNNRNILISDDIELIQISDGFYMHQTFVNSSEFGRFSSNGVLVIKNGKAFMIDSPVTNELTEKIATYLKDSMNVQLQLFTGGHFHNDCVGGMEYLKKTGVKTFLNSRTEKKCKELNLPLPDTTFNENYLFRFEGIPVECRFVGGGHSADNITVYFPDQKILFGGCLIKSLNSTNLGNLQDAVVSEWKATVQQLINFYPAVKVVVPGHGDFGGIDLLYHTIDLVDKYQKKE